MDAYLAPNPLGYPILSLLILLPLLGAVIGLFLRGDKVLKYWAMVVTLANAVISVPLFSNFDSSSALYQFSEKSTWIELFNIHYVLGIDGISLLLVMLTTFVMPLCILCSWKYIDKRVKEFVFSMLIMEAAMVGVFAALDLVLFYVFWEAMLIPMYLLIAVWGGDNRAYASVKFFLYTLAGSVMLLVAIIALYMSQGTFYIPELMGKGYSFLFQFWVFLAFALAFAIKVPMFPFHTWLPAAHVEAPTPGSVILASVLLKMGTYGFLRFCLPITPAATLYLAPVFLWGSILSILYGGFVALGQKDMKKLIAYSSVGHMGFVTLGIFLLNAEGIEGAILQMVNHGITTGALFICVGLVYERSHSRLIADNSAIGSAMPMFVAFFTLFSLSSLGFPGTNSFVGELYVLIGAFKQNKILGAFAIPGALLAATYMLRLLQKIIWDRVSGHHGHGEAHGAHAEAHGHGGGHHFFDLNVREFATLSILAFFVLWIGLVPRPFIRVMDASVNNVIQQSQAGRAVAMPESVGQLAQTVFGLGSHGAPAAGGHGGGHEPAVEQSHGQATEHAAPAEGHGEAPEAPAAVPHAPAAEPAGAGH
jgi:NADH-quinone oxidoreductase subunit M